jgi:hypothetical protein
VLVFVMMCYPVARHPDAAHIAPEPSRFRLCRRWPANSMPLQHVGCGKKQRGHAVCCTSQSGTHAVSGGSTAGRKVHLENQAPHEGKSQQPSSESAPRSGMPCVPKLILHHLLHVCVQKRCRCGSSLSGSAVAGWMAHMHC